MRATTWLSTKGPGFILLLSGLLLFFGGKYIALRGIDFYQCYISPYKGFSCAYRVHHGGLSCSEYGRHVIATDGVLVGAVRLFQRFQECEAAASLPAESPLLATQVGCECCGTGEGWATRGCLRLGVLVLLPLLLLALWSIWQSYRR